MTALYIIAGYALGAVLTWVVAIWRVSKVHQNWTYNEAFPCFLLGLFWPILAPITVAVVTVDRTGTRLFNYFKRRV